MDKGFQLKQLGESIYNVSSRGSILIPRIDPGEQERTTKPKGIGVAAVKKIISRDKSRILLGVCAVFLIISVYFGIAFYRVFLNAQKVKEGVFKAQEAVKQQDLVRIKTDLEGARSALSALQKSYKLVSPLKFVPFFGLYIRDGEHVLNAGSYALDAAFLVVDAAEPYADIIGLKNGSQSESPEETTQDRLDFVIKTLPELIPKAGELNNKVLLARQELDQVDPARYPQTFFGKLVREKIKGAKELVDLGSSLLIKGKPLLEVSPDLLGVNGQKRYLILFQNDKELRPTGGFITAYTVALVRNGRFEPVSSNDIYNLDSLYTPRIDAPDPIIDYIKGPYLIYKKYRLRDLNWSPDFSESMSLFSQEAETAGIKDVDGIIAVDTQVLVDILNVLGPIGVPGFGNFSTEIVPECNCPQVIYELESFADTEGPIVWSQDEPGKIIYAPPGYFERADNRKKIIGPLMNSILANALGQPKEKLPSLFEAAMKSLLEKHVLFYMHNEKYQAALKSFGVGGTIEEYEGDYLHINDANLGGRKSNLYLTQEVEQQISVSKGGSVEKILTITYKNPTPQDGWLNSILPNWVRIYVPKGSQLLSFGGVEKQQDPYEEFGKSVFAGYFELRPQGIVKVVIKYKLPFKVKDEYKLLIQKQPGKDAPLYTIDLGKSREEFFLRTDKEIKLDL